MQIVPVEGSRFPSFLGTPWHLPIIQSIGEGGQVFTHSSTVQPPPPGRPDFAALYGTYDRTGEPRFTPRTASAEVVYDSPTLSGDAGMGTATA
ncbi:hypothetical protein GCM10010199_08930 [Dactylosporangium roseum]